MIKLLFLTATLLVQTPQTGAQKTNEQVVTGWNTCVNSLKAEWTCWEELHESLKKYPPGYIVTNRRRELYDELIRAHEVRLKALRDMRKAECK